MFLESMKEKSITESKKIFIGKILITAFFIASFIFHKTIQIDSIGLILLILAVSPWLQPILESIEITGIFKANWKNMDEANKEIKYEKSLDEEEITFGNSKIIERASKEIQKRFISFKARINYDHEAGSNYLLKVKINDRYLDEISIANRAEFQLKADGRRFYSYSKEFDSWLLCYSPDFISNYRSHNRHKIMNGDPYLFVFDISSIQPVDNKYKIEIEHTGREGSPAFRNSIIIKDFECY
jgi:hypothetical protein